ncbi:hypothetical protein AB0H25_40440, partial [Actinosynnema sp. NPDC023926]
SLNPRPPHDVFPSYGFGRLFSASFSVLVAGARRPTLDDVFLTLTGHAAGTGTEEKQGEQGA